MSKQPTLYPLTYSQQTMYLNLKYSFGRKQIVNISTIMHIDAEVDVNLLLQASYMAIIRNKAAATRLRKVGKEIKHYYSEQAPEPILVLDYSDRTQEEFDEAVTRFSATPFPNNALDTQLYRLWLLKKPDGFWGVHLCVNHIAFDAFALMMTASEILKIYVCLRDNKPIPPSKCDPIACIEKEYEYMQSERRKKDMAFWNNDPDAFGTEPLYTTVNGKNDGDYIKGKRFGKTLKLGRTRGAHKNYKIPKELVDRVNELAVKLGVSSQSLYLLAARSYLSKTNENREDVTIYVNTARRSTIVQKHAYGTRVHGLPFRFNFPNILTFTEAAAKIHAIQLKYFAHVNANTLEVVDLFHKKFNVPALEGYATLYFTFQPYFLSLEDVDLPVRLTIHSNGACAMPLYLTVMALDNSGELTCIYDHSIQFLKPGVAYAFHKHLLKALYTATQDPDITLAELNKL